MRTSLLVASVALLLPSAVLAGSWPPGTKDAYMDLCLQVARTQGIDAKMADKQCKCGAEAIEKKFTTEEIAALGGKESVDAKLMQRAQAVVADACTPK